MLRSDGRVSIFTLIGGRELLAPQKPLHLFYEAGGGAPEKLWKLKVRRMGIDLVTGEIFRE